MLKELATVMKWYKDEPEKAWNFEEIIFTEEVREILSGIGFSIDVYSLSAKINTKGQNKNEMDNSCFIPSQYVSYAVKVKPLGTLLYQYMKIWDKLKAHTDIKSTLKEIIEAKPRKIDSPAFTQLDKYSIDSFFDIFAIEEKRLKAKTIFSKTGVRSTEDFFGSVLLKCIPVPNASSWMLGKFIYHLCSHPDKYDLLERNYAQFIPFFSSPQTGNEILYRLFFILGLKGYLDDNASLLSIEKEIALTGKDNLFDLSTTAQGRKQKYCNEPLWHLQTEKKYIHLLDNILELEEGLSKINTMLEVFYLGMEIRESLTKEESPKQYILCNKAFIDKNKQRITGGTNKIYYGAPGTGKSYKINLDTKGHPVFRTVFHPDTQYSDFVGTLKPCMGEDGVEYAFRPGPFTVAYIKATRNPNTKVFIIIEELNRAQAAAVFGEIFQLLDRDKNGRSVYDIDISDPDMAEYIQSKVGSPDGIGKLRIPSNLSLLATMNSSDQAVMPMDTAFKRRWQFEYLPIDYEKATHGSFTVYCSKSDAFKITWKDFAKIINEHLTKLNIPEDRLLGHYFLSEIDLNSNNAQDSLKGKLLVYLWDDVLRHNKRQHIFADKINSKTVATFGHLISEFEARNSIFNEEIGEKLKAKGTDLFLTELTGQSDEQRH